MPQIATHRRPRVRRWHPKQRARARLRRPGLPALRGELGDLWPFALPLLAGLLLRLAVIPPRPVLDLAPLVADEGNYVGIAESLAAGAGIPDRWIWLRPPGYPLFLAGFLRLADDNLRAPLLAQVFVGTATLLIVALLAGQLWGRRGALVAATWTALDPSLIYYTRILHAEVLYTALLLLAALALTRYATPGATWRPLAMAAVAVGCAALCRPTVIATLPFLALWVALRHWHGDLRTGLRHAALLLGLVAAVIAPNAARNWVAYERIIPLDTTLGYIFWLDHRDVSKEEVIATLGAIPNPGDRQARALREGLAWIAAHPGETVVRTVGNLRIIWGDGVYVADAVGKRQGVANGWHYTIEALCLLNWLLVITLALIAVCRALRPDRFLPLGIIAILGPSIGVGLSHPENRYMLPSLPIFIALAAGALTTRATAAHARWRSLVSLAAVSLFLVNCWLIGAAEGHQRLAIAGHWLSARGAERLGATDAAIRHYDAMQAWNVRLSEPDERKAALDRARGDDTTALALALRAVARDGTNFRARVIAAQIWQARNQPDEVRRLVGNTGATMPDALAWAWDHTAPPPGLTLVTLDGTDIGVARGFYNAEQGAGRRFRWSSADSAVRLTPPVGARTLTLTLASPRAPTDPPVEVAIRVNGRKIGLATVRRELGWNTITVPLPGEFADGRPLTVDLHAPVTRAPGDRRVLGVAVSQITVEGDAEDGRQRARRRAQSRVCYAPLKARLVRRRLPTYVPHQWYSFGPARAHR